MEFLQWLKQSPLHVREMLLAITWDAKLNRIDSDHKIDIPALLEGLDANVLAMQPDRDK